MMLCSSDNHYTMAPILSALNISSSTSWQATIPEDIENKLSLSSNRFFQLLIQSQHLITALSSSIMRLGLKFLLPFRESNPIPLLKSAIKVAVLRLNKSIIFRDSQSFGTKGLHNLWCFKFNRAEATVRRDLK